MSWGLVAVAGATVVSSHLGSKAAGEAAEAQTEAAEAGAAEQRRQFDITQQQLAPFREAGVTALGQQQALLGLGTPEEQQQAFAAFAESPGQQFLRSQQERALLRSASAIGGLGGGNVRTALQQQAFGRAQTDYQNQLNRLAALSGTAQTATTDIGQFGAQAAGNIAQLQAAGGAARASGILGQQQAIQQGISGLTGIAAQSGAFSPAPQTQTLEQQLRATQGLPAGSFLPPST
ncbi:hypothetical protein KAR91_03205 [Candidatus Pacearchaeota archaeon]|nr:hypothetical protein [Candidatus Pacearchaeota archaeon]